MNNVVFITPFFLPSFNGISFSTLSHAKALHDLGFNVYIFSNSKYIGNSTFFNHIHIPIYGSGLPWNRTFGKKDILYNNLNLLKPEFIFIEGWYSWGAHLIKTINKYCNKIILISHGSKFVTKDFTFKNFIKKIGYFYYDIFYKNQQYKYCIAITVLSDYFDRIRFNEIKKFNKIKLKYYILPNVGILNSQNKPFLNIDQNFDSASIVVIGEMCENKNQIGLLRYLIDSKNLKKLIFYYPSENLYSLKLKEISKNITKIKIDFNVGYDREQIFSRLNSISLLAISSNTEAQPLVLLDAISIGIPFISTRVGCIPSIHGGVISNLKDFATTVDSLLNNSDYYKNLSRSGIAYYQNHHSYSAINKVFERIINESRKL
jgi:glycosyltransferase involved in cell wall biosynthesis